jgi:sigma-B regulation protein RsbU (phosphoserine phosphatase)
MAAARAEVWEQNRLSRVIFEHAARISRQQDFAALLRVIADLARDLVGAQRCSIWLIDSRTSELWTKVAHGVREIRIPAGKGIVGACIAQRETIIANDISSDSRFLRNVDESSGFATHSILCVPMCTDSEVIGTLQVLNKANGFSNEDAELLHFMAIYAASTIQAERLRHEAEGARLLKYELDIAAGVQRKLLPSEVLPVPGIEYAGVCRPARFVGGDYYDFITAQSGFGFTLGDISGKGFPAAVLMASIHTLLRSYLTRDLSNLGDAFVDLNNNLYHNFRAERYSTLFCGVLSPDRRQLTYANAGHIPPFVIKSLSGSVLRPRENNLPIGLLPDVSYEQHVIPLESGDLLLCVSDGLLEAENTSGQTWDEQRLTYMLSAVRHLPVEQIVAALVNDVAEFAGPAEQFDDMTAVIVRCL